MRVFFGWVDGVDVNIDRWSHHSQTIDAGLFLSFAQCDMSQVGVAVSMTTRLQPTLELGVEQHQTGSSTGIDNKGGPGQMTGPACAHRDIRMRVDELQDAVTVLVEPGANRVNEELAGEGPVLAHGKFGRVGDDRE